MSDPPEDLSSLELCHVRAYMTQIIQFYIAMERLRIAELAERALVRYIDVLDRRELHQQLEQTQRFISQWRSDLNAD